MQINFISHKCWETKRITIIQMSKVQNLWAPVLAMHEPSQEWGMLLRCFLWVDEGNQWDAGHSRCQGPIWWCQLLFIFIFWVRGRICGVDDLINFNRHEKTFSLSFLRLPSSCSFSNCLLCFTSRFYGILRSCGPCACNSIMLKIVKLKSALQSSKSVQCRLSCNFA